MKSTQLNIYQRILDELTENILIGVDRKLKSYFDKYKPSKKEEDELLTVDETLKILKCSKQALWNWRKNGILPSYRMGNRVYYKKSDIFSKLTKQE
ncbi:helix-turn-helix domain-containing protein [Winogradskyella eckloniae]|uniref:helix-turn-helix domain-containing protein n=1 Tax=Winogradskyella eckloniae TaxID=1089306 RepID=UPI00156702D2|nr:helix-turn-helix domain-containing protein [Winogradskyella eckloniae]NRD19333.1 helix-turn-helix domain-containing protein [Winogradskyella eckloniae]